MNHLPCSISTLILGLLQAANCLGDTAVSPMGLALSANGHRLYVAASSTTNILVIDPGAWQVITQYPVPGNPRSLALSRDGRWLYVTCGESDGRLLGLSTVDGRIQFSLAAGHTPMSPVISSNGQRLYLCIRHESAIAVFDLVNRQLLTRVPVAREPVAASLGANGKYLFVANHLPATPALQDNVSAAVSVIATDNHTVVREIRLPNGSTGVRGLCVSPDQSFVYITHLLARYPMPTTQLERGWMNTAALTILDAVSFGTPSTVLLDDVDQGAANPWGVRCSTDGRWLVVAHAGTHELSLIDRTGLHSRLAKVIQGEKVSEVIRSPEDVPNDLSFLVGLRRRISLSGKGPRELAISGSQVFAAAYFSDSLHRVDLASAASPEHRVLTLGPGRFTDPIRLGELYFNDAALCFQGWQSCASCHPDARTDSLNWDLLNDGLGNPKNTKSMLLAHSTPPAMSLGIRETAETAVRAGIRSIQFAVRPEAEALAIDAYLKSLSPVPSPRLLQGQLSESAQRGRTVFQRAGCAKCHPAPLFTDCKPYNVGTGTGAEKEAEFDTPALIETWRTAPYLHDGRATTILDLFRDHNADNRHGHTSALTRQELIDLAEYVLSL
jgi:DNA-binding beta-propeller fold protein YncE